MTHTLRSTTGFTLAELLIALAILGVIATFTIPKILSSTGTSKLKAVAKEAASMVSAGFQDYQINNDVVSTTAVENLTSNLNYVTAGAAATVSSVPSGETAMSACVATTAAGDVNCLQLHNGGLLEYRKGNQFGGTASTNYVTFNIDPDGTGSGAGAATFVLYANGRLTTGGNVSGTTGGSALTQIATDPSWISSWN